MAFEGASFLLQWAAGGLLFLWVTTRRREVSLGYGWLMRATYLLMALGAAYVGLFVIDPVPVRDAASVGVAVAAGVALAVSIRRKAAGVAGDRARAGARSARVAAMLGQGDGGAADVTGRSADSSVTGPQAGRRGQPTGPREFPPVLDLVAPVIGFLGILGTGLVEGDPAWLATLRLLVGAAFLGAVTDAMLLGHWYLVQPGMARSPLLELVRWVGILWVPEVLVMLIPTGMVAVLTGAIDDGYGGLLGWFWLACAVTTGGLVVVTRLALRERAYSAVMAATGLLYLAILTAFGTDLVARALLSGH
jgi:hypothetical protein